MLLGGAARNRMLVQGASSFNSLVRALKQDLVEGKAPHKALQDPKLLYQIDKVGLQDLPAPPAPLCTISMNCNPSAENIEDSSLRI